ncbi:dTDP-4-dehydrorhamnose 3,5-epimerase [bacterium SCSIO 12741]|nr:dTDP-4-dehydrorhamnose 3,5-epimerase [bacterium SCSIO 12741]
MQFTETQIKGVFEIAPRVLEDDRGGFFRLYCADELKKVGIHRPVVQTNISINNKKGVLRGMHFQNLPSQEDKLVTCIQGAAFDVVVDLRKNSPTFLQWTSIELSAENKTVVCIPAGCAHGFITREDDTRLLYHHTDFYTPSCEGAFRYDDPQVGIEWPFEPIIISERDLSHKFLDKNFNGLDHEM